VPERAFVTETWDDDWFHKLSRDQRYLFIYLWTNIRCTPAGVYHINLATIASEAKFAEEELPELLKSLVPKVEWYPEQNYVWVRNFIKWQAKSPKFLIAAAKCFKNIRNNGLVKEVINYNLKEHGISIPYEEAIDKVSVGYGYPTDTSLVPSPSNTAPDTGTGKKENRVVKGKEKAELATGEDIPRSRTEAEETLCEGDREVISVWCSVKGFKMAPADASALVARLRTEFPDLDILDESKAWAARKLSEPLKQGSKPSAQIWNWMRMARRFTQERRQHEQRKPRAGEHQPDPVQAMREAGWDTEGEESDEPGKAD